MGSMPRIGIVGGGFNAWFHCRALANVRGVEVSGIHTASGHVAENVLKVIATANLTNGRGLVRYASVGDLVREVDIVLLAMPNFARVAVVREIAEAVETGAKLTGVICEKPLGRNLTEATELVDLATEVGLNTAYFENQIHMPSIRLARQQLASVEAAMGPVHLARSAEEHGGPHEPWFWDPTKQGGGVWCDMGCHSAAVGLELVTPSGQAPDFMEPVSVTATMALLKWGLPKWKQMLYERGVDYDLTPAEDYANVTIRFRNPLTGQVVLVQATDAWCYDAPGLRLLMEAFGPGYSHTVDTLKAPTGLFIGDAAATAVADAEIALEKSQASRGALLLQHDEPVLYGYVAEWQDAIGCFAAGRDAYLNWAYGRKITALVIAGYRAHEEGNTITLDGWDDLFIAVDDYVPLIQQGHGNQVL